MKMFLVLVEAVVLVARRCYLGDGAFLESHLLHALMMEAAVVVVVVVIVGVSLSLAIACCLADVVFLESHLLHASWMVLEEEVVGLVHYSLGSFLTTCFRLKYRLCCVSSWRVFFSSLHFL
jgi:hypothetical protein